MKIAVISFSAAGAALANQIIGALAEKGHSADGYIIRSHAKETAQIPFDSVTSLTAQLFSVANALVYIGALGIAVRSIAPHIKSKLKDPAVVVCDELGKYAVSVLSGHAGGANELAAQIATAINAVPVITTASDIHAMTEDTPKAKNLILGIGCRKGLSAELIERTATIMLWNNKIPLSRVCEIATVDIKQNDTGLIGFAKAHDIPLRFFSAQELAKVKGEFTASERVLKAVGVDNVCERAAVLCGINGRLVLRKTAKNGVTVAVFEKE